MGSRIGKLGRHKATGLWFVRIDGKQRYFKGIKTQEDAEAKLAEIQAETKLNNQGPAQNDQNVELRVLLERYLKENDSEGCDGHRKHRRTFVGGFMASKYGTYTNAKLTADHVEAWVKEHKTWGACYRALAYKHLSHAFNWFLSKKLLTSNPVRDIKRPRTVGRCEDYLISLEEHLAILEASLERYRPIWELLWETGARPSEILGLEGREYHSKDGVICKREHKTAYLDKKRNICLSDRAVVIVEEAVQVHGGGLLFPSIHENKTTATNLGVTLSKIVKAVGIAHPVIPYSYRHSFAVRHLERGLAAHVVAGFLGDTLAVFDKHYGHIVERIRNQRHLLNVE